MRTIFVAPGSRRPYVPAAALKDARAEIARLREALFIAQGEAYLGTLAGDDTPDPLSACHNVISTCLAVKEAA